MTRLVRHPLVIATCVLLIPFVVLVVRITRGHFVSTSDLSLIELRTRDVGSSNTPLVGPYSRFAWNHPGPLLFYVLAIPYRLFGATSRSLLIGGTLVSAGSIGAIAYLCWRRGRSAALALGLIITLALTNALGGSTLMFPWNPFVIVLPMLMLALLSWSVACGDHWMLPVAIGVASFVTQSHVGAGAPAFVLLAIAAAYFVADGVRGRVEHRGQLIAWSVGVAFFAWVPPIIEQFRPDGGNLGALRDYFTAGHNNTVGYENAARLIAPELSLPAPWFTGHEGISPFGGGLEYAWQIPFVLAVLVIATLVAWRRRDRETLSLDVIALALVGAGWIATANIVDLPFPYLLKWAWVIGAVAWFAIGWTVIRAVRERASPQQRHVAAAVASVAVAALVVLTTLSSVRAHFPDPGTEQLVRAISRPTLDAVRAAPKPILVTGTGGILGGAVSSWLLLELTRAGIAAGTDTGFQFAVGASHVVAARSARTNVMVAANDQVDQFENDPRYRKIASVDELPPADRAYMTFVNGQLGTLDPYARLAWHQQHPVESKRLAELSTHSNRVAIFLASPPPS